MKKIFITILSFYAILLFFSFFFDSESSDQGGPKAELKKDEQLIGEVNFDGIQFHISNQGGNSWKMCYFTLNDNFKFPSTTSDWQSPPKIESIKSGEILSIGASNFTKNDGTRFNPFSTKPMSMSASCQNGFEFWMW